MKDNTELLSLDGEVAIVTGAGGGIGLGIAKRLQQAGAQVVLVDLHHDNVMAAAAELNGQRPDSVLPVHADVSDEHDVIGIVRQALERFGKVDVLVNNAGIFPNNPLADMDYEQFDKVLKVNLYSVYLLTKHVSDHMKTQGGGKIINVTSIDALHPSMVGLAHYDASKHGVWGFTKNAALELAEHKIWVNAIAPGGVATPGVAAMQQGNDTVDPEVMKQAQAAFLEKIPMRRMGEPDDIAKVALFLASDMSSYITGSQIVVDGGALLR